MDKNLPAFLRTDCYTVEVRFMKDTRFEDKNFTLLGRGDDTLVQYSDKTYMYVTDIPNLQEYDDVIVIVMGVPKVVRIVEIHKEVCIEPNESLEYKWIVQRVDYSAFNANIKRNEEIKKTCHEAYKRNARNSFAKMIMAELPTEEQVKLMTLVNGGQK